MATDITPVTTTYSDADRGWLLGEAEGNPGPTLGRTSGQINWTLFTANTHYPNGFIPSGTFLGRVTSTGKLGPYNDSLSNGQEVCVGISYNNERVPTNTAQTSTVPFIDSFATVRVSRLPSSSGIDTAARVDLPLIKFRA